MVRPVRWQFPFPQGASFRRSGSSRGSPVARAGRDRPSRGKTLRLRRQSGGTEELGSSASWDDGEGIPLAIPSGETFPLINTKRYCCHHASHADIPGQVPCHPGPTPEEAGRLDGVTEGQTGRGGSETRGLGAPHEHRHFHAARLLFHPHFHQAARALPVWSPREHYLKMPRPTSRGSSKDR